MIGCRVVISIRRGRMMARANKGISNQGSIPPKLRMTVVMGISLVMMRLSNSLWIFLSKVLSLIMIDLSKFKYFALILVEIYY